MKNIITDNMQIIVIVDYDFNFDCNYDLLKKLPNGIQRAIDLLYYIKGLKQSFSNDLAWSKMKKIQATM